MDQSMINGKTGASSSLVNYKDDEKLMSESLYRNLHVLARFYEPSAEFRLIFHPLMFIKSNAKAFFPVFHFIFNCLLDAAEFNKRFRWPLLDKTAETNFRTAAVDYMNHLNVTHQLGLETLKLSNIHIPGGLKFIKIVHKFTYLAMKLELAKPEHRPLPHAHDLPDGDDMLEKLEEYVELGMNFATRLQVQSDKLSNRIDEMRKTMESCFGDEIAESNKKEICWACLQNEWQDDLDHAVGDDVGAKLETINLFSQRVVQLNGMLTKLFVDKRENLVECNTAELIGAQNFLKERFGDLQPVIDGIVDGNVINFDSLLKVLFVMLPTIMKKIEKFKFGEPEAVEYEFNEIVQYDAMATKYYDDFNEYNDQIQPFIERDLENFLKFCQNYANLPFNLIQTPPVTRQANRMRNRLGLIDDLIKKTQLFKEPLPPPPRASTRNKTVLGASSCSSLSNSSSREAALQLLAKPKSRANLSQSSNMSNVSILSKFSSTPKLSSAASSMTGIGMNLQSEMKFPPSHATTSKSTQSSMAGRRLNVPSEMPQSMAMAPTRVFPENSTETTSMLPPNIIPAVRKLAASSTINVNEPHLRSPSRRFYVTNIPPEFAAMMQRNKNLDEINNWTSMDRATATNVHQENTGKLTHETVNHGNHREARIAASEADELDFEFIGNVSDTVLNDISME